MTIDLQKIADNLVVAFVGGWFTWVTFGLLKAKRDLDFAHRHLRSMQKCLKQLLDKQSKGS